MSSEEQRNEDCKFIAEALAAGPRRYDQMESGIRAVYRRWNFDLSTDTVQDVLAMLEGRCIFCSEPGCGNACQKEFIS